MLSLPLAPQRVSSSSTVQVVYGPPRGPALVKVLGHPQLELGLLGGVERGTRGESLVFALPSFGGTAQGAMFRWVDYR